MPVCLFLFRRDFRTEGNPAWARCAGWAAGRGCDVAPCFIYSDRQLDPSRNAYFSPPAYSEMRAALDGLAGELGGRLSFFHARGDAPDTDVLDALARAHDVSGVFFNSDVTPFAVARDRAIAAWCASRGVPCDGGEPGEGYLLWPAGTVLTKAGTVPRSFSAFYRYTAGRPLPAPAPAGRPPRLVRLPAPSRRFAVGRLPEAVPRPPGPSAREALASLERGDFDGYGETRDDYRLPTTRLSVHLKFGRLGAAEAVAAARRRGVAELERQLLWREYYYHLAAGYPEVLTAPNAHIRPDRQRVRWGRPDARAARRWLLGRTGEPLVDQAMAELRRSGYLHNRLRMVVASYFTRDMGLDWREGERLLATLLADYDPCQNSGGWQSMDAQVPGQEIKASTQLRKYGPV